MDVRTPYVEQPALQRNGAVSSAEELEPANRWERNLAPQCPDWPHGNRTLQILSWHETVPQRAMPDFLHPGVFIEEIGSNAHSIAGVSTSVTTFIGTARKIRVNKAVHIRSFADFQEVFGALENRSDLGYAVHQFFENGGCEAWVVRAARPMATRQIAKAFAALDNVERFNLLVLPGLSSPRILTMALDYCQRRRAFLVADAPRAQSAREMLTFKASLPKTSHGAIYFPWIQVLDPVSGARRVTPPGGSIAGLIARTDAERGVWKAPAGSSATLKLVEGLEHDITEAENSLLNPRAINCLRTFQGAAPVVWGARTLEGDDLLASEWKYIPVRRTALFIEESVSQGTQWTVFKPNDESLWTKLRLTVGAFMQSLFRQGAFQGQTPREAYFVKCDAETTTAGDITNGVVNITIGFAPLKPAEFVVIRITQRAGTTNP